MFANIKQLAVYRSIQLKRYIETNMRYRKLSCCWLINATVYYTTTHNYSIHCPKKSAQTSRIGSALISLSLAEYTRVCSYEWVYFANWIALTSI